jgi:molecular chaperone GrpE
VTDDATTEDRADAGADATPATAADATPVDGAAAAAAEDAASEQPANEPPTDEQATNGHGSSVDDQPGHELAEGEQPDWDGRAAEDGRTPGQLLEALEEVQADRDDYLDALQRSRAEFDNFRRRSAREAAGARAAGAGDLATKLLDVLDDLDRTVQVAEDSSDEGLAAGITAVRRKLVDALLAAGVERIDEEGVRFDATRHEAVQKVDAEEPLDEPEVAQVLRPGYVHNERVLRAAMVSVRQ